MLHASARADALGQRWSMGERRRRDDAPPPRADLHPSEREREIIETAAATAPKLPELHAAGRMFFRFDPGFRSEVECARREWNGSTAALSVDGLSEEHRHDLRAWLHDRKNERFRSIGIRLAKRWGLDLDTTLDAIAFDTAPRYPFAEVRPWETDPETGCRYAELRVYSAYVWKRLWSVLTDLGMAENREDMAWFWDRPQSSRVRLRGMDGDVAARTLAIHFLMREPPGRRATGGTRTWEEAARLWAALAPTGMTRLGPDARPGWSQDRVRLLRFVISLCASPVRALTVELLDRAIDDEDWSADLGIAQETWRSIRAEEPVDRGVWDQVKAARPALAADIDAYLEFGLLNLAR